MTPDLCSDCPPVGYPTDKTRCLPCPRRNPHPLGDDGVKMKDELARAEDARSAHASDAELETVARAIAFAHGAKMVLRRGGETLTNATLAGYPWKMDDPAHARYAEDHWREFITHASFAIEAMPRAVPSPKAEGTGEDEVVAPASPTRSASARPTASELEAAHRQGFVAGQVAEAQRFAHPVFAFLLGSGSLNGHWFGEALPKKDGVRPKSYWWRAHLRAAMPELEAEGHAPVSASAEGGSHIPPVSSDGGEGK